MENQVNELISLMQYFPWEIRPVMLEKILAKGMKKFHLKLKKSEGQIFVESPDGNLYGLFQPTLFHNKDSAEEISIESLKEDLEEALETLPKSLLNFNEAFGNLNEVSPEDAKKIMANFFDNLPPRFAVQVITYRFNGNDLYEITLTKDSNEVTMFFFNDLESLDEIHLDEYNVSCYKDGDDLHALMMNTYEDCMEELMVELL